MPHSPGEEADRPARSTSTMNELVRYSGLGLQFAAAVALFSLGGRWLDGRLGSSPWFLLVGAFLGFGLGLYSLLKKVPSTRPRPGDPSSK